MNVRRLPLPRVLPQCTSRPGGTPPYFSRVQSRRQQYERFSDDLFFAANLAICARTPKFLPRCRGLSRRLAGYGAGGWSTIADRNRNSAHASPGCAVARKIVNSRRSHLMSSLPRLRAAERSDRNRTTRRRPVGGSSLARATLVARARSAED